MNDELLKKFDKNEVIFREGDSGDEMYIVHSGSVRLVKQIQLKFETIASFERGDFFGEMSLIDPGKSRMATAIAMEPATTLVTVNKSAFEKMLQSNVEITLKMIRQYAERLNTTTQRLEKLLQDQQALDTGIQDILSNVRRRSEPEDDFRENFGWLESEEHKAKLLLKRPEVLIGRKDLNAQNFPGIDLTPYDQHRTVSRRHARLSCMDEGVYLFQEPGVVNGTLINGQQIEKGKMVPVNHQDKLQFGKLELILLLPLKNPLA